MKLGVIHSFGFHFVFFSLLGNLNSGYNADYEILQLFDFNTGVTFLLACMVFNCVLYSWLLVLTVHC